MKKTLNLSKEEVIDIVLNSLKCKEQNTSVFIKTKWVGFKKQPYEIHPIHNLWDGLEISIKE